MGGLLAGAGRETVEWNVESPLVAGFIRFRIRWISHCSGLEYILQQFFLI